MKSLNLSKKKILVGGGLLLTPMFVMAASLTIVGEDVGSCTYNNFDVASNGDLVITLSAGNSCNFANADPSNPAPPPPTTPPPTTTPPTTTPPTTTPPAASSELVKYNQNVYAYSGKSSFDKVSVNGRTVYIVNQGGDDTSVPSCVNGRKLTRDCAPTGWSIGVKGDEVYALRAKTKAAYTDAQVRSRKNQHAGGATLQANYSYVISDQPGKMTSPWAGRCSYSDIGSSSTAYLSSNQSDYAYKCKVPANTLFYVNIQLKDAAEKAKCNTGICSGYLMFNGLDIPNYYKPNNGQ